MVGDDVEDGKGSVVLGQLVEWIIGDSSNNFNMILAATIVIIKQVK